MNEDEVLYALRELAEVVESEGSLGVALAAAAETATRAVPGCDSASIALSIEGRPVTAAMTSRVALELDMVQYDTHDGPCLTSFRSLSTLRLNVAERDAAFPHFARAANDLGIKGVLSVPAMWGPDIVATLNLYSRSGPFDETATSVAAVLAAQVSVAVSRSPEFSAGRTAVERLQRDMDDQAELQMATGLLMYNQACTADQAAGLLRAAAHDDELTVLQIARRIIDQHHGSR